MAIKELLPVDFAIRQANSPTVVARTERDRESLVWARQRFIEEGRMVVSLRHPHILAVHDILEQNGTGYLVTGFIQSGDFHQWLTRRGNQVTEAELRTVAWPCLADLSNFGRHQQFVSNPW